jgi:hypothetical protein
MSAGSACAAPPGIFCAIYTDSTVPRRPVTSRPCLQLVAYMQRKAIIRPAVITGLVLLVPLVLTLLNPSAHIHGGTGGGWDWAPGDFLVMGVLLFGAGLIYEFLASYARTAGQKAVIAVMVVGAVLVIWTELAVDAVSRAIALIF